MYLPGKDGDRLSSLYDAHVNGLHSYGTGLGFSHDACMDAIQDVFCKLFFKIETINAETAKYYLFRSFRNRLIDLYKSKKKEIAYPDISDLPFHVEVTVVDTLIEEEEQEQIKKKVDQLMGMLTQRQREAIYLRYMEELEYDEIGKILRMNAESVRKLVFRGIEKLRQQKNNIPLLHIILLAFVLSNN